jgi:DNA-binding FadR family transcriptional regulator
MITFEPEHVLAVASIDTRARSKASKLHDRVADELGIAIVSGRYPPGTFLATEVEASEKLNVSRTAYREAMRVLLSKGLVTSRPKSGTRVNARKDWVILDPAVLGWIFASGPDEAFVRSIFELRGVIEPAAAALAARRRSAQQLSKLGHALEEMDRHGLDSPAGASADQLFHECILEAAGNEPLAGLSNSITFAIRMTSMFSYRAEVPPPDPIPAHRALYAAIADRDADNAHARAASLIDEAFKDTMRSMGPVMPMKRRVGAPAR